MWYLVLGNGTEAAIRAGYAEKWAKSQAHHNLRQHPGIKAALASAEQAVNELRTQHEDVLRSTAKLAAHEALTREWVIDRLRENVARAMQAEPVLDREGNPTGEYTYQGAVANGALKLLGEEIGMFVQRSKVDVTHRSPSRLTEVERNAMLREFLEDRGN